jgi:hypothetical protein
LLLFVEIEKADAVVEEMMPGLSNKQPKIIAATLAALTAIFHAYGVRIVDPKPVLKALPKVFGHADKNVRAEASNLCVEIYRWLKEAIKTLFWNDLKPIQQQDLEKAFEAVKQEPNPKQERLLRSQQAAKAAAPVGQAEEHPEEEDEGPAEVDAFDLAEPQEVLSKFPSDFYDNMASTKWKERKEALDAVYAIVHVDRIKDGSYDEFVAILAKSMKDANVAVVTVAANCIECLAKGLRKSFGKYRGRIMSPIFERLKEKKQSVADALGAALDAIFGATSFSDCLEETLGFLTHKNPQVKLETLRFLIRCLKTTREAPSKAETKAIADAAIKLLTESTEVTRAGGAEILGTLMKIMGERQMTPYLDGLDEIRKAKIKEFFEVAEVKAKDKPKPVAAPPPRAAPPPKKVVGKKPPPGMATKKPAPRPQSPLDDILPPPKSTQRPGPVSKLGGPGKTGLAPPGAGLKLQKRPLGQAVPILSSPKRSYSPAPEDDAPPPPRIGLSGRGLAGRALTKPAFGQAEALAPVMMQGMTAAEKAELESLRADKERLQRANEELRTQTTKLGIEINELRTHEAELIEERTRNRLTIKAKETQLVRARSDAEIAEETVQKQQREMDRLKRELSRAVRATSPPPMDINDQIYRDANFVHGVDRYESNRISKEAGYQRARAYMTSPSEEKENGGLNGNIQGKLVNSGSPQGGRLSASEGSRGASPRGGSRVVSQEQNGAGGGGEPIESWKRAAQVTSQLKARIEQMKVCSNAL